MRIIKEDALLAEIANQMGWTKFDEEWFPEMVERVDVGMDEIRVARRSVKAR